MRLAWRSGASRAACARHGAALFDLIDGGVAGSRTDAALEHIATCDRCRDEAADAALLVVWLNRLGTERRRAAAGTDEPERTASRHRAWGRIHARIERRTRPAATGRMAGLLTVPLLVLALAGPRLFAPPACPVATSDAAGVAAIGCVQPIDGPVAVATQHPAAPAATPAAGVTGAVAPAAGVPNLPGGRTSAVLARDVEPPAASQPPTAPPVQPREPTRSVPRGGVAFPI